MRLAPPAPALYAGFGCRQGCPADTLQALLRGALAAHGLAPALLRGIASIDLKANEPGLQELARRLALPLVLFSPAQLHAFEPLLSHRSATTFQHSGCWGVAESAALALASQAQGPAALRVTRQVLGPATLALASGG
ncbi:cobalamin biosynthesis protein [Pseudomonas sp. I2]|uniref:cobalamin biosynthesis protein n=1 Tax=Pseudomonas sp. I2 TaxID=1338438 RepID=UPI0034D5666C